jgi:chromosome segregation ATPase
MSKTMIERILVLVIILVLTTFLFFILNGNRKSQEGMEGVSGHVKINGVEITNNTPNEVLEDLLQRGRQAKARFEQKIKDYQKDIENNNQAYNGLVKERDTYHSEIKKNNEDIDKYEKTINDAYINNQFFTEDNKRLDFEIDSLNKKLSNLQIQLENIEKRKDSSNKYYRRNINQTRQTRINGRINHKTQKIISNEDKIVDIAYFQNKIKTLLERQIELENLLHSNQKNMDIYINLKNEIKGQNNFYQSKLDELKKDITYLEAAMQDLTSRTKNPGSGSIALSSTGSSKT